MQYRFHPRHVDRGPFFVHRYFVFYALWHASRYLGGLQGTAMIDNVQRLVILSVVTRIVAAANLGAEAVIFVVRGRHHSGRRPASLQNGHPVW